MDVWYRETPDVCLASRTGTPPLTWLESAHTPLSQNNRLRCEPLCAHTSGIVASNSADGQESWHPLCENCDGQLSVCRKSNIDVWVKGLIGQFSNSY